MYKKGIEKKTIISLLGTTTYHRGRYICHKCKQTYYFVDEEYDLSRSKSSKRLAKSIASLSVFMPFADVKRNIYDLLQIDVSTTFIEQLSVRIGDTLYKNAKKISKRPYKITDKEKDVDTLYIGADGAMVPLIEEEGVNYRENKLGILFNNNDIVQKKTKHNKIERKIIRKKIVNSLADGVEVFKEMLFAGAVEKGYYSAKVVVFLSDGASWLIKCKDEYFPNAIRILDWYHAIEHLWDTAYKIFGEENKQACKSWVAPIEKLLWDGKVEEVLNYLKDEINTRKTRQEPLIKLHGYYTTNKDAMKYDFYRDKGLIIGSGFVESANKYIIAQRLKMSGMKWKKQNANAMIWLRSKYCEKNWDNFWDSMKLSEYYNVNSRSGSKAA